MKINNTIETTYRHKDIELKGKSTLKTIYLKPNTLEHFVVDRYIAFIKSHKRKTVQYKIKHKPWKLLKLKNIQINNNILQLFPTEFKYAKHVMSCFVDGSAVTVEKGILQPS